MFSFILLLWLCQWQRMYPKPHTRRRKQTDSHRTSRICVVEIGMPAIQLSTHRGHWGMHLLSHRMDDSINDTQEMRKTKRRIVCNAIVRNSSSFFVDFGIEFSLGGAQHKSNRFECTSIQFERKFTKLTAIGRRNRAWKRCTRVHRLTGVVFVSVCVCTALLRHSTQISC